MRRMFSVLTGLVANRDVMLPKQLLGVVRVEETDEEG